MAIQMRSKNGEFGGTSWIDEFGEPYGFSALSSGFTSHWVGDPWDPRCQEQAIKHIEELLKVVAEHEFLGEISGR